MSTRKWTQEQRQKQGQVIRSWKPWEKSTGAKTSTGKAISSKNAIKTGRSLELRRFAKYLNKLLRDQKDLIR